MTGFLTSPVRNLLGGLLFMLAVSAAGIVGYVAEGWSVGDSLYMVVITVFSVGYGEVRPVATPELRAITIGLIVLGCTGMIFLTGVLVQFITLSGIRDIIGSRHMSHQIERLSGHVIICGFGRIGNMLARELRAARAEFIVLERSAERIEEARALGYLCLHADASDEGMLRRAGVAQAKFLATVLPDDAINVFITLSARSLNPTVRIIARGEAPSTVSKLKYAGANEVVLPAHIGAERMAELILYPDAARALQRTEAEETGLHALGLDLEVVVTEPASDFAGRTVAEVEAAAAFFIVAIDRPGHGMINRPDPTTTLAPGDGVTILGRADRAIALRGFQAKA